MRVLIIGPDPSDQNRTGGVAKYMSYLQRLSSLHGFVSKLGFIYTDSPLFSRLRLHFFSRFVATLRILLVLTINKKVRVVHINASLSRFGGWRILPMVIACKVRRHSIYVQIHGGRFSDVRGSVVARHVWEGIFSLVDKIGSFSGPQFAELAELDSIRNKLSILRNFVLPPINSASSKVGGRFRFLFLGRMIAEKGVLDIIEAVKLLNHNNVLCDSYEVIFAGLGTLYDGIPRATLPPNCKFLGYVEGEALEELLESCHSLLLPTYYPEGFPLAVLESSAHGLVPIASDNSAISEYFIDQIHYLNVTPKSPQHLANKMRWLLEDSEGYERMSYEVRTLVTEGFSCESPTIVAQYEKWWGI